MQNHEDLILIISEEDLDESVRSEIASIQKGEKVLGEDNREIKNMLYEQLPGVITKRLEKMIPSNFCISEIELKILLTGKLLGVEVGGEVILKLSPDKG